jgi:hypothetical protein
MSLFRYGEFLKLMWSNYRNIFGTDDDEPKWVKKQILRLERCELADDSEEFAWMLNKAFEAYMLVAGIEDILLDRR